MYHIMNRLTFPLENCDPYLVQESLREVTLLIEAALQFDPGAPDLRQLTALHTILNAQHTANVHNDGLA